MQRIKNQDEYDAQLAEKTLYWISFSMRPLTIREIQHALAVTPEDTDFDDEALPHQDILVSVCAGLVTIDHESCVIRLVHYTTQQYFERIRQTRFPYGQMNVATCCLLYISFNVFSEGHCGSDKELEKRMHKYPLLEYAAQNWGAHARGEPEEVIKELSQKFFANNSKVACSSQIMHLPDYRYANYSQVFPKQITGLHIAAYFGLSRIVQFLLGNGSVDVDSKDSNRRTPLSWASQNGQENVVQLLISCREVNVDVRDKDGRTPLSLAAGNGHEAVVRLLIQHNANPDSKANDGRTPLSWAAEKGHTNVVQLLLALGRCVEANSRDHLYGRSPLSWAAEKGHEEVVRLLLQLDDVDLGSVDTAYGQTPLSYAAEHGHVGVLRMMLEREGLDVDMGDDYGQSPLTYAVRGDHDEVVRLLLQYKRVNIAPKDGATTMLLSWAEEKGPKAVLQMLRKCEGTASSYDADGQDKATWLTVTDDHETSVRRLLQRSIVRSDPMEGYCQALLLWAVKNGHEAVVRKLMECTKAQPDFVDNLYGRTLLSWAAQRGYTDLVQLLLNHGGFHVNSKDNCGQSALSLASQRGHEGAVQLLLACKDIDADSKDQLGRTPLSFAGGNGHKAVVRLLMERKDVDADMGDNYDNTPLSWAADRGRAAVVELLLSSGRVTADFKDICDRTPLSLAAGNGREKVVQLFLKRDDVDVNIKDNRGRTALTWAMSHGHEGVVQLLEDFLHSARSNHNNSSLKD
jgi:ankyrin repeat protein